MQQIGILLAGGQSSRMGQDKASLLWQQGTLLQHMQQCLDASLCEQVLLSRNHNQGIHDRFNNKGPLAGIDAVLQQLPEHCLLTVIPVDMPLLDTTSLIHLQAYSAKTHRSVCYVNCFLPCVLVVNNALRNYIEHQLSQHGNYSIKAMLQFVDAEFIAHPQPNKLFNTNTPQQWNEVINTHASSLVHTGAKPFK